MFPEFFIKILQHINYITFTVAVAIYCSIITSRLRDFWKLKFNAWKSLYYLKEIRFNKHNEWVLHGTIFEISLKLKLLEHNLSSKRIKKIASKLYNYLNKEESKKERNNELTKNIITKCIKEIKPDINISESDNYINIIPDKFLENSIKTIKKLKPNYCAIFYFPKETPNDKKIP